ncbi:type II toxin-antitoxin system TacA family antitoxin [Nocardioides sp. B-3]|uniref:type II toxin-antitoxin system TacA family antitoxin n=1 Tax=Nocardioides sp. B-3 TaxID=2895565 RepID=UPI002152D3D6|nr:DUF1778 domain-containing protein [Nocardioides sp. B-3]UUZ59684.1 DUF1778 domain-containing protein [Nocardioides sp. B-3]
MATATKPKSKARLEARIDVALDELITEAADRLHVSKTAFVTDAVRDAALKVIARADVTLMAPGVFDAMMGSIDIADESPELESPGRSSAPNHRVSTRTYTVAKLAPEHELEAFDCGESGYNDWLTQHAAASARAGVSAVYLLLEAEADQTRVVGYYAINPTQILRAEVPHSMSRGWPQAVPAWKLGKLVLHVDLRAEKDAQWGRQLLRHALETIVRVADAGGGKVIVVDADNRGPRRVLCAQRIQANRDRRRPVSLPQVVDRAKSARTPALTRTPRPPPASPPAGPGGARRG